MSAVHEAVQSVEGLFAVTQYPAPFLDKYDPMECLASHRGLETFLVQDKDAKRLYVAKCYDKSVYIDAQETTILRSLHHKGLPAFADEFQNDRMLCIVREYVEGTPLNQYAAENELSQKQIAALCIELCDILIYLHEQQPPVIHRDIKPQNIIIRRDGKPTLIDFDTARTFKKEADSDTQFLGTKGYAPPEQYGFTQTDCRADIYALGVLLRFLFTGSAQESENNAAPASVQKIIAKCTAFSPQERFSSARAVQKALLALDEHKRQRRAQLLMLAMTAVLFLCAGFALGRYTRLLTPPAAGATFEEPLIERAVRVQLDKGEDEPITENDLKEVRALCLFGDHVSKSPKTLDGFHEGERGKRGSVRSLDDLALMPNLEEVVVSYQALEDISGLSVLKHLVSVDFKHNQISDLSPLANMQLLLGDMITQNDLHIHMVVCVSGDTQAMSKLLDTYMLSLISGHVRLSVVHGMTQTVTSAMHVLIPGQLCLLIHETIGLAAPPIGVLLRDERFVRETESNFEATARYAQPVLHVFGDEYTRHVIEVLALEYCSPGALDVVKDSMNPMFMTTAAYDRFLKTCGHSQQEYAWRSAEFARFKVGMDGNLHNGSRFREVISLSRLNSVVQHGSCGMAGLYFAELGFVDLDRQGCVDILHGYIDYLEREPNFELLILDDLPELHGNNCWHIKKDGHITINNWQGKSPVMIYSDQLMLLREFQARYDALWVKGAAAIGNRARVISLLRDVAGRMKP